MKKRYNEFDWGAFVCLVDEKNNILEVLACCDTFAIGYAAYKAAVERRTSALVQLREKSRIVWTAKTGFYDHKTDKVELIWERN